MINLYLSFDCYFYWTISFRGLISQLTGLFIYLLNNSYPRSKNTGRFRQESIGNRWNVEAVFPPENFRIFSDDFRLIPTGKLGELTGIHRKKIR